jgi:hypothetical protein
MELLNLGHCIQCWRLVGAQPQSERDPFRSWSHRIHYPVAAVGVSSSLSRCKTATPYSRIPRPQRPHRLAAEQHRAGLAGVFLKPKQADPIMNTPYSDQTVRTKEQEAGVADRRTLDSISIPIGTFAGSEDRIVRIRKRQIVPADTGDQGGGQN